MTNKIEKYSAYKDSGVEWLGEIPEHWKYERLASILVNVAERNRTDLPLLSITREKGVILRDIENEDENHNFIPDDLSNYKVLRKGQFGMNKMKAWQGSYGISKQDGIVSPAYFIFKLRDDIDSYYFHLAIRSRLYISFFGSSSDGVRIGQWDLSRNRMQNIPFLIPPLHEQKLIAAFIDRKTTLIDQAIGIKQKQIVLLKERRQILIHEAVTKGVNYDLNDEMNTMIKNQIPSKNQKNQSSRQMKDSGVEWIGEIPVDWEIKRLKELCKVFGRIGFRGYTTSDLVSEGEGAITISPSNIKEEFMVFEKCSYLNWDKYQQSPEIQIFENDVLMVKTGSTFGKTGIVKNLPQKATINPQLLVFKEIKINSEYFYTLLKTSIVKYQIHTEVIGSTIPTISETKILNFKVAIPRAKEIDKMVLYIEVINKKFTTAISLKEQEIEKLKEYKATLINNVVTGKIKIS